MRGENVRTHTHVHALERGEGGRRRRALTPRASYIPHTPPPRTAPHHPKKKKEKKPHPHTTNPNNNNNRREEGTQDAHPHARGKSPLRLLALATRNSPESQWPSPSLSAPPRTRPLSSPSPSPHTPLPAPHSLPHPYPPHPALHPPPHTPHPSRATLALALMVPQDGTETADAVLALGGDEEHGEVEFVGGVVVWVWGWGGARWGGGGAGGAGRGGGGAGVGWGVRGSARGDGTRRGQQGRSGGAAHDGGDGDGDGGGAGAACEDGGLARARGEDGAEDVEGVRGGRRAAESVASHVVCGGAGRVWRTQSGGGGGAALGAAGAAVEVGRGGGVAEGEAGAREGRCGGRCEGGVGQARVGVLLLQVERGRRADGCQRRAGAGAVGEGRGRGVARVGVGVVVRGLAQEPRGEELGDDARGRAGRGGVVLWGGALRLGGEDACLLVARLGEEVLEGLVHVGRAAAVEQRTGLALCVEEAGQVCGVPRGRWSAGGGLTGYGCHGK
ncbi:hypothetical protein K439DRAFT_1658113 [Ramaria rubella]|nr:hypothetical protein K439DRAFT_1658113 [Ramaria rubella]